MTLTVCRECVGAGAMRARLLWLFPVRRACRACEGTGRSRCRCGRIRRQGSRYCSEACAHAAVPAANEPSAPRRTIEVERFADTIPVLVDVDE